MNVSARTNGLGLAGGNLRSAPMQQHSGGSFWSALSAVCAEKSGGVFTDGSTVRKSGVRSRQYDRGAVQIAAQ